VQDIGWASVDSALNTEGNVLAPGILYDQHADGFTGFTFNVLTYPGLRELHDRAFEELKTRLYAAFPEHAARGTLDRGPQGLDDIYPGLYLLYQLRGSIPDLVTERFIPFQFHVMASATTLTRSEFVGKSLKDAETLRQAILADSSATPALLTLAADATHWGQLYLAALEEAGLLRPDGELPPLREHPLIVSTVATLSAGILAGPAGNSIRTTGSLSEFFERVRAWYGHDDNLKAPIEGINSVGNPIPAVPLPAQFDFGASKRTHFEAFRVYAPWIKFEDRGAGVPPEFQISGVDLTGGAPFDPLDLSRYLASSARTTGVASLVGPYTGDSGGFSPLTSHYLSPSISRMIPSRSPMPMKFESSPSSIRASIREPSDSATSRSAILPSTFPPGVACSRASLTLYKHEDSCFASRRASI
jgi:hypothetical protein